MNLKGIGKIITPVLDGDDLKVLAVLAVVVVVVGIALVVVAGFAGIAVAVFEVAAR